MREPPAPGSTVPTDRDGEPDANRPARDANASAPPAGDATRPARKRDGGDRRGPAPAPEQQEANVRAAIRKELAAEDPDAVAAPEEDPEAHRAIIALDGVSLSFDGDTVLDKISFAAHEGETIVVVGESGTGKSTTLKLILRHLVPDAGRVLVDGKDIVGLTFDEALEVRQRMGMVFQGAALFDSMSVFENVAYPLREQTKLSEEEIDARVREKLQFVDLDPDKVIDQLPAELSGGMKKRVGIARGMANNPQIMLYDEPTSGLDPLTTGTITRLIMKLQRELKVTSIVVSHDIRSAFRMGTKIALLSDHKISFFGTPEEMAASEDKYIRDFLGGS